VVLEEAGPARNELDQQANRSDLEEHPPTKREIADLDLVLTATTTNIPN
jgi:hypothetical protein